MPAALWESLTPEEQRETADVQTSARRIRRRVESEASARDRWGFEVPYDAARLFDQLERDGLDRFDLDDAEEAGAALELDEADVAEALAALTARELVTATAEETGAVFIRHPDLRSWF